MSSIMLTRKDGERPEPLFGSTLYPPLIDKDQAQQNAQILIKALKKTPRKLLFIAPFTRAQIDCPTTAETFLRVGTSLGITLNIDKQVHKRALSDSKVTKLPSDTPLLALGTAKPQTFRSRAGNDVPSAWVTAVTFLPVAADRLTPLPDSQLGRYVACMATSALYVAEPADDPLMHLSV